MTSSSVLHCEGTIFSFIITKHLPERYFESIDIDFIDIDIDISYSSSNFYPLLPSIDNSCQNPTLTWLQNGDFSKSIVSTYIYYMTLYYEEELFLFLIYYLHRSMDSFFMQWVITCYYQFVILRLTFSKIWPTETSLRWFQCPLTLYFWVLPTFFHITYFPGTSCPSLFQLRNQPFVQATHKCEHTYYTYTQTHMHSYLLM